MELFSESRRTCLCYPIKTSFKAVFSFWLTLLAFPWVATDVGSFREEIVEGETGFVCRPGDVADLAGTLEKYFASDLLSWLAHPAAGNSGIREQGAFLGCGLRS